MGVIKTTKPGPAGRKGGINTVLALPYVPHESRPRNHTIVPDTPPSTGDLLGIDRLLPKTMAGPRGLGQAVTHVSIEARLQ